MQNRKKSSKGKPSHGEPPLVNRKAVSSNRQQQQQLIAALAQHASVTQTALAALRPSMRVTATTRNGAFAGLGSDVDSMIEHGQEAWRSVKRLLNVENKRVQITGNPSVGYTGVVADITSNIAQGDTDSSRDGDSCKIVEADVRIGLQFNTAGTTPQYVRWMLLRSHDEAVTASQVNPGDGTGYAPFSQRVWDNRFQYTVIEEGWCYLALDRTAHLVQIKKKLDSHVQFTGGSTTVNTGAIQLMLWSNVVANLPVANYSAELTFVDN